MPAPLSEDLRKRIIRALNEGESYAQISKNLQVNKSTISRLLKRYRESGSYAPRPLNNGRKPRLNEEMLQKIRDKIKEQSDVTLRELIEEFSLPVSAPALCKTLKKMGLVRKKKRYMQKNRNEKT